MGGGSPGSSPRQVARVVLDAVAVARLAQHLEVEHRALVEPLRLEELPLRLQSGLHLHELRLDRLHRVGEAGLGGHVVARGVDRHLGEPPRRLAGERVEGADPLHLVPEQLDADPALLVGGHDLDHVPAHAEGPPLQLVVVALVAGLDEAREQVPPVEDVALPDEEQHPVVGLGRAEAVDARHRRHDQHVAALEEAPGGGEAEPVDLLVDRGLLLDVGVRLRDVGLGLVVVVVRDEVLDRVLREERLELLVELGGQRLVVGEHQGRAVDPRDHGRHGEGLARARDPEQHLVLVAALEPRDELLDRGRLVPAGLEVAHQLEAGVRLRGSEAHGLGTRGCHPDIITKGVRS